MKRLTEQAEADRTDFISTHGSGGNCSCHISPPCDSCLHPGNPLNQDENPQAWEEAKEVE